MSHRSRYLSRSRQPTLDTEHLIELLDNQFVCPTVSCRFSATTSKHVAAHLYYSHCLSSTEVRRAYIPEACKISARQRRSYPTYRYFSPVRTSHESRIQQSYSLAERLQALASGNDLYREVPPGASSKPLRFDEGCEMDILLQHRDHHPFLQMSEFYAASATTAPSIPPYHEFQSVQRGQCLNRANRPRSPSPRNSPVQRSNEGDNRQSHPDQSKHRRSRHRHRKESTIDLEQLRGSIGSSPDLQFEIDTVSPSSTKQSSDKNRNQKSPNMSTVQTPAPVSSVSNTALQAVQQST